MNNKVLPFPVNSFNKTNLNPSPRRFVPETDVDRKVIAFPAQGNTPRRRGLYASLDLLPLVQAALAGEPSMRPKLVRGFHTTTAAGASRVTRVEK